MVHAFYVHVLLFRLSYYLPYLVKVPLHFGPSLSYYSCKM
jgi:hypothetical protein